MKTIEKLDIIDHLYFPKIPTVCHKLNEVIDHLNAANDRVSKNDNNINPLSITNLGMKQLADMLLQQQLITPVEYVGMVPVPDEAKAPVSEKDEPQSGAAKALKQQLDHEMKSFYEEFGRTVYESLSKVHSQALSSHPIFGVTGLNIQQGLQGSNAPGAKGSSK